MNPELLKKLQELTASLRGGLVFNPLDELQKRATQTGEDFGYGLEKQHAQAGYAKAYPESQRAQSEMFSNMAMLALGIKAGEKPSLVPAIKTLDGKIVDGITHSHAYMDAGITEALPAKHEGYVDLAKGKFYTRQAAEKLMENFMSKSVKAQVAERSRQAGKDMGITTEDLNGKLYANRGTRADPPMTLEDMDRNVAEAKARKAKGAAMDSAVTLGSRLHDELSKNGGFTIDPKTGEPLTSGYSVGGGEKSGVLLKKSLADLKPNELQSFLDANKNKLLPGQAWGGWADNGTAYIEPADQITDLNAAQRLGNERGEKAIWDHASKSEIPLKAAQREAEAAHADEFASVMHKWHSVWGDLQNTAHDITNLNQERRASLLAALRTPDFIIPQVLKPK